MCLSVCLWQRVKQLVLQRAGINESISLGAFVKAILPQLEPACKGFFHVCHNRFLLLQIVLKQNYDSLPKYFSFYLAKFRCDCSA